ncbi:hypothetical protein CO057_04335 [Candidatus Uhrbacteria bacterium CG_4_9_14_0_2_um_filter_41_50]|uniref:Aminoacyl-transfer RNA synthetases class-II family profile domain-containing protein n=1 Tax=Candidatus Uhrbacteria bacterium CG_4_9_14_0_2_um_filter_41_50 TaxID=1975031 RepID=A0A2M8EN03_9BACT|nr:MAG: hypothetical protein COZ45_01590 [Candidatus Uhrbacteria bacterium CG_4_10_14_3_um_filter_41_21]PIZ55149.1 MAG: hypothetical protein COY24_01285 [Candidatus Uhrbacteria bacterium CG_4_10_14_0_2_um_filter_41_21]PJB84856.1 MAG: hypothetical protein CO086_01140 [Candidatus Uhrbacteria bacterium CG_4_9_14_0_8_um_filter_41_16]PJC24116.1 MAG: hypothetical protein CO057_04335 [Candidatus Uhrbacteria bacterium CG_4_9_14_0_2_um_filter_41_50]PJE75005.1 MAG: hypothetical protein COV03_02205 [Candi
MLSKDDILRRQAMGDNVVAAVHHFFRSRGYLGFNPPLLVRYPDLAPTIDPVVVELDIFNPAPEKTDAALITSPEFAMKKLLGAGFEKIYTVTRCFRAGEALAPHNSPEFTMLEWYRVGANYESCMRETEALVNHIMGWEGEWPRVEYKDANMDEDEDPRVDHNRFFVMNYPPEKAALAKLSEDGKYAERFEAYAGGMELCNGFSELIDAKEQRIRFEQEQEERRKMGKRVFGIDEELLESLAKINRPVCGNALGVDRLVMLKYGVGDINDIHIFPPRDRFKK